MSLANITEQVVANGQAHDILKKFQWAIKRVNKEVNPNDNTSLTSDELIDLIRVWEPQRDIICLYVRWARQLKRNFNLDSIATLLCLSRQCGYTPIDFLRKVKTLSIHKNDKAIYGLSFHFDIPNRKEINRKRLKKEFLGLSVTLALLQQQVSVSPSVLGKTGMRHTAPRTPFPMDIPIENENTTEQASLVSHPTIEFHTQTSLLNRIWISINHRWLTLFVVEHLFRSTNSAWSYPNALVYSFQMMAPCGPGRFEFLSPLAGYCLRFPTEESIELRRQQLQHIWEDSSTFLSYGNSCLTQLSDDTKAQIIQQCFLDLRSDIPVTSKKVSYNRDSTWVRRWTMIRGYIFHFWLEAVANKSIKEVVADTITLSLKREKRKARQCNVPETAPQRNVIANASTDVAVEVHHTVTPSKRTKCVDIVNGLLSITATRHPYRNPSVEGVNSTRATNDALQAKEHPLSVGNGPSNTSDYLRNIKWGHVRLIAGEEMSQLIKSYLLIHRSDGVDVLADLSPMEVYSANHLRKYTHERLSGFPPFYPQHSLGAAILHIRNESDHFIDMSSKSYHVAREQSQYFKEYAHELPSMHNIQQLCQAIVDNGRHDGKRGNGQYRINIGCGGRNWQEGSPCKLHGLQFQKDLEKAGNLNPTETLRCIGKITAFTWKVVTRLQEDSSDHTIAPDKRRKHMYASHLNKYLLMEDNVGFEDLTLVVSTLYPVVQQVIPHKDAMNDNIAGYTRTAAFNMVMMEDSHEGEPYVILFQVLCNFRKVIGHYLLPFYKYVTPVVQHAQQYLDKWHKSMHSIFAGKSDEVPNAFDRSSFFLDDCLEYTNITISDESRHRCTVRAEYLLTEVSPSRTLSLSMFINAIVNLQRHLKVDQTIELAFACSFLSNPFWFDWIMSDLTRRIEDPNDSCVLGEHPFYDWASNTIAFFGTWQGGPYNRWSPCGGTKETIIQIFGAQAQATETERLVGQKKLVQVVTVLCEHVKWINSLSHLEPSNGIDISLNDIKARCHKTIKEICRIASCQFGQFRLGILITILSGCGLLIPGKHLRQLMYPVKGAASYKHLSAPVADYMSEQRAREISENEDNVLIQNDGSGTISEEGHDEFMKCVSGELGFKSYLRDEMECILCESHPMRSLNCRDWFRKGMSVFDCNQDGQFFRRDYGKDTEWTQLRPPPHYDFAYVGKTNIEYITVDEVFAQLALDFGKELRTERKTSITFKGRNSRTSSHQRTYTNLFNNIDLFPQLSMKIADFFVSTKAKRHKIKSMFVLGDSENAVETRYCNNLENYFWGKRVYKYLQNTLGTETNTDTPIAAGCYHMDLEQNTDETTYFHGHLDKSFVHTVWFVNVGMSSFFTIISCSNQLGYLQDVRSIAAFNEWTEKLSNRERKNIETFLHDFDVQARRINGNDLTVRLIYLCTPGSALAFAANKCYHATITPKKPLGYPRDLFIFHPLDGNK